MVYMSYIPTTLITNAARERPMQTERDSEYCYNPSKKLPLTNAKPQTILCSSGWPKIIYDFPQPVISVSIYKDTFDHTIRNKNITQCILYFISEHNYPLPFQ